MTTGSEMIRLVNTDSRFFKDKGIRDPLPTRGPYCTNSCVRPYLTSRQANKHVGMVVILNTNFHV